jgi:hypothetical protein
MICYAINYGLSKTERNLRRRKKYKVSDIMRKSKYDIEHTIQAFLKIIL